MYYCSGSYNKDKLSSSVILITGMNKDKSEDSIHPPVTHILSVHQTISSLKSYWLKIASVRTEHVFGTQAGTESDLTAFHQENAAVHKRNF